MSIYLPPELLSIIIAHIVPASSTRVLACKPSSPETRTLYNLLWLSKSTYSTVQAQLYTHCLYVASPEQLIQLCRSYTTAVETPYSLSVTGKVSLSRSLCLAWQTASEMEDSLPAVVGNIQLLFQTLSTSLTSLMLGIDSERMGYMPIRDFYDQVEAFCSLVKNVKVLIGLMPAQYHLINSLPIYLPRLQGISLLEAHLSRNTASTWSWMKIQHVVLFSPFFQTWGEMHFLTEFVRRLPPSVKTLRIVDCFSKLKVFIQHQHSESMQKIMHPRRLELDCIEDKLGLPRYADMEHLLRRQLIRRWIEENPLDLLPG